MDLEVEDGKTGLGNGKHAEILDDTALLGAIIQKSGRLVGEVGVRISVRINGKLYHGEKLAVKVQLKRERKAA